MKNKIMYSAIASLSVATTGNVNAAENHNEYIKLASISPIIEVAGDILVTVQSETTQEQKENEADSKGYVKNLTCPPDDDPTLCVRVSMDDTPEGSTYYKCTCYCNGENTCMEMGYTKTYCSLDEGEVLKEMCFDNKHMKCKCNPCDGFTYENSCPSGWNSTDSCKKCGTVMHKCQITPQQKCKDEGYINGLICTDYKKSTECSYDSTYKKCVNMNDGEKCVKDGYVLNKTCSGYYKPSDCSFDSAYKKCVAMTNQEKCIKDGYAYNKTCSGYYKPSNCSFDSAYKKCVAMTNAEKCIKDGYAYNKTCSGYYKPSNCSFDSAYKKCVAMTNAEKCIKDGYAYNKTCSGYYKPSNCSFDSAYKKCVAMTNQEKCAKDGYRKTSCSTGYELKTKCSFANYYKTCEETPEKKCKDRGYFKTSCSSGYELREKCTYANYYKRCDILPWKRCLDGGYVKNKTCSGYYKTSNCAYDSVYRKCVPMTPAEKCIKNGYVKNKSCSGYYKPSSCSFEASYKKCVPMNNQEKCIKDGFVKNKTCGGYTKPTNCTFDNSYKKCISMTGYEKCNKDGYKKTSCQSGYVLKDKCSYGNYYKRCEITPAQKCRDAGYTQTSCGTYFTTVNCPYLSSQKRCDSTCESNLVAKGYKVNQNASGAIITKSMTISGSTAPYVNSVESYRSTPKCTSSLRPKPTLTLSGVTRMQRYYSGLNIKAINTSSVEVGGTTIYNGHADFGTANVYAYKGSFYHRSSGSRVNFKAGILGCASNGYSCTLENVTTTLKRLVANNGGNVYIKKTNFYADDMKIFTANSYKTEFSDNSYIRVKATELGRNNYVRGARLRIKGNSKWYMTYGNVIVSDGAHFCVDDDDGSAIYFKNGYKKGGRGRSGYDGCRIYNDKTRTLSYNDWDPSKYTSWKIRSYCAQ